MNNQQFDYIALIFMIVAIVGATVGYLRNPQKFSIENPLKTLIIGFSFLIFTILVNNDQEHRSDFGYIYSFLCLKKVSLYHHGFYVRSMLAVSYIAIFVGGLQLLARRKSNASK
jgi:hypothetical protein